ncbi:MAG: hypothetical protein ACYSU7_14270 [Planctomycetota bacterium]|jgi:hypothetical protein
MSMMVNERKLKAAALSMHQFCQQVRHIFPGDVSDRMVEASTVYLYVSLARDLFGQRFATRLQKRLRGKLKYATPAEVDGHLGRITKQSEAVEKTLAAQKQGEQNAEEIVRAHVEAVIDAMLDDAGFKISDPEVGKKAYVKFEEAIREIRKHLMGVKDQNHFLMKNKPAA